MPYSLPLLHTLRQAGWKVKIHDLERLEPPHVTIYFKMQKWRLSLRSASFLDRGDKWSQIDDGVREAIDAVWATFRAEWDRIHPDNPVGGRKMTKTIPRVFTAEVVRKRKSRMVTARYFVLDSDRALIG